jgi:FSR family fosmidomycin resistance protein-like MFS transporter
MRLPSDRIFWGVSLGHMLNDTFMSTRSVLLTFISAYILPMTSRQVGFALSLVELTGAISQPFFGWLADRTGGRWLGAGGVAVTVIMFCVAIVVVMTGASYWLMLIPLALAGLGSGAFHPVGSMYATHTSPQQAGRNAALFFMFGQLGLGIGPAVTGILLENAHSRINEWFAPALGASFPHLLLEHGTVLPVIGLSVVAIPVIWLMARTLPDKPEPRQPKAAVQNAAPPQPLRKWPFVILALAVSARGLSSLATVAFMPYMFQLKGWSPSEYGLLSSSFWVASGLAGVWFGMMGDRYDSRRVITLSLMVSAPGVFLLPSLSGVLAFAAAILVGAMSGSHSLIVVLGQSLLPGRKGFASGAVLGLIFATGALGNLIVGDFIARIGAANTFQLIAVITLFGSLLWLLLPSVKHSSSTAA